MARKRAAKKGTYFSDLVNPWDRKCDFAGCSKAATKQANPTEGELSSGVCYCTEHANKVEHELNKHS